MHHARDAEDRRPLDTSQHQLLLAGYFHQVRERCFLRLRDRDAADDAAQQVFLRLARELERGRTYPVPYRVVVHKVTDWVLRGFYPGAKRDGALPENWDPEAPDAYNELEQDARTACDLRRRHRDLRRCRHSALGLPGRSWACCRLGAGGVRMAPVPRDGSPRR
jgi:DNA-directed RNA polymerase specialized sigma24 family protein